jgi:hypothetical protein
LPLHPAQHPDLLLAIYRPGGLMCNELSQMPGGRSNELAA